MDYDASAASAEPRSPAPATEYIPNPDAALSSGSSHNGMAEEKSDRHRRHHSSSRHRSRSRDRPRRHQRSRSRSRSRSRDRYRHSSSKSYSSRSYSRDEYERSRDRDRDHGRSRDRSRSRERRDRDRGRSAERNERRERDENDKLYAVEESERDLRTVFVRNMPLKATEKDIMEFFGNLSCKVRAVSLITDKSKKSKGFGYVEFYEKSSVDKSMLYSGTEFWGKKIEITDSGADRAKGVQITTAASIGPTKLFVSQLHYAITQDMIREIYSIYGDVEKIELQVDEIGVSKGTAIVQYKAAESAKLALEETNGIEVAGRHLRVGYVNDPRPDNLMMQHPMMPFSSMQNQSQQGMPNDVERLEDDAHVKTAQQRAQLMAKLQSRDPDFQNAQLTGMGAPAAMLVTGQANTLGGYVPQSATGILGMPSQCIVLKNMFNPAEETAPDFDKEIAEDVKEECSQYGRVLHVFVDKNSMGFVYLKFESTQAALQAGQALHGRWFAGKMVSVEYIPEVTYDGQFPDARGRQ